MVCGKAGLTAQAVLRDDVALHLASPAVPPIPRDRAMVQVLRPRPWPKRRQSVVGIVGTVVSDRLEKRAVRFLPRSTSTTSTFYPRVRS